MSKAVLPSNTRVSAHHAAPRRSALLLALWALAGCRPINDLDLASSEFGHAGRGNTPLEAGAAGTPPMPPLNQDGSSGSGNGLAGTPAGGSAGTLELGGAPDIAGSSQGGASTAGMPAPAGTTGGSGGRTDGSIAGDGGEAGATNLALPELPNDLPNSPVVGTISVSTGTLTIGTTAVGTFEIATPTADYSVSRSSGNIISLNDKTSGNLLQWVSISNTRPKRGVGLTMTRPPTMTTTVDQDSVTAKHVRLVSQSVAGDFSWQWDFYVTQATLTVTQAAAPFGFSYRGTPAGALDSNDRLGTSSGALQPATDSFYADLPGPAEWAYVSDTAIGHSLFLIQHRDDAMNERYESKDADSAAWTFGDGLISQTPARFSVGMLGSTSYRAVQARVAFIVEALQ